MNQNFRVLSINVDGTIARQAQIAGQLDGVIELQDHEQKLRLWPITASAHHARHEIRRWRQRFAADSAWITFLGSGDLNHLSAFLIESLPASCRPLHVVLIDNHPDWFRLPPAYHCGNWVGTLLRQTWVESVTILGPGPGDLSGHSFLLSPLPDLLSGRLTIHPWQTRQATVPLIGKQARTPWLTARARAGSTDLEFKTLREAKEALPQSLRERFAGGNVYLCIDKDILSPEFARTDWDQGQMSLTELNELVRLVFAAAGRICGIDICGDRARNPLTPLLKRADAGRLFSPNSDTYDGDNALNAATNIELLSVLRQAARENAPALPIRGQAQ